MIGKWIFRQFMRFQVFVYRRTGGERMNRIRGMPILLLTTVGRNTGKQRITPVVYIRDGNNYVITAANNGGDKNPGWFLNLKANPQTTIEVDGVTRDMAARQASAEEKARLWPELVEKGPFFEGYRKNTARDIPMVILEEANQSS